MAVAMLVGLHVVDDQTYQVYRETMLPILQRYGGGFRYDFKIAEVLRTEIEAPINRVFIIFFADKEAMKSFFANDEYLQIRQKYYEPSVASTTIIATFDQT